MPRPKRISKRGSGTTSLLRWASSKKALVNASRQGRSCIPHAISGERAESTMNELTRRDFVRGGLTAGIGIGIAPELLRSAVARQPQAPAAAADPYAMVDPELLDTIKKFPFPTQSFTSET